jgi:hypothetical protein
LSVQVSGNGGVGQTTVYTFAQGQTSMIETLSFTIVTAAIAGNHMVRVTLSMPTVGVIARLDDLNLSSPGQTNFYTYGVGLNAAACTLPAGLAVTDALPWTDLLPGSQVIITPISDTGVTLADTISDVLLQLAQDTAQAPVDTAPLPLSLLPAAAAA